jgi:hypothetical protein
MWPTAPHRWRTCIAGKGCACSHPSRPYPATAGGACHEGAPELDSFKTQVQFFDNPWSWPTSLDLSNYVYAWNVAHIPRFMLNSTIVAGGTIPLRLTVSATDTRYATGR